MVRNILSIIIVAMALMISNVNAQTSVGDWQLHPAFDYYFKNVIDSKDRTYIHALSQGCYADAVGYETEFPSLFVYDKEADEIMSYHSRNYLSEDVVSYVSYNEAKGYLLIVYENSNIDILYDDDTVYNIPGYMSAVMTTSKDINHVTFDVENNRIYLATKFGYFSINDEKHEIAESHIYNVNLLSVGRVGERLIVFSESAVYWSPISDPHLSMSSFSQINGLSSVSMMLPMTDTTFAYKNSDGNLCYAAIDSNGAIATKVLISDNIQTGHSIADNGYILRANWNAYRLSVDGNVSAIAVPEENRTQCFSSYDFKEFWFVMPRKGLSSKKYENDAWTLTRDYFMPNSPAVFRALTMDYSPKYGLLCGNEGMNQVFTTNWVDYRHLISGYKDLEWVNYGGAFTESPFGNYIRDGYGPVVDPINEDVVYVGSYKHGLFAMNLSTDVITQYSRPNDDTRNLQGFNEVFPNSSWGYCKVSEPSFDSENTLWLTHDTQSVTGGANSLYYWKADSRASGKVSDFKSVEVKGFESKHFNVILPLKRTKNIIMMGNGVYGGPIWAYNHNGTLDNPADDKVVKFTTIYDQDGNSIPFTYVYNFYEDQQTGRVWVCTYNGVFNLNPSNMFDSDFRAHRVKVARNDGTNQADYLLDGVPVYGMTSDGGNRKWFATAGGGAVLTSSDGSEVIRQLTVDNSYLPNNNVYAIKCDPESNSVWMGTHMGIAQYFSDSTPSQNDYESVKAYPNPVRPDYLGWVTIEGLMDLSLVKIVDSSGALVKELGRSSGGMITWDLTNLESKRVKTGVYYVLASQSEDGQSMANVSKILVVN